MSNSNSTTRKKCYDKRYEDMIFISDYLYDLFYKNNLIDEYSDEISYIFLDGILKSGVLKFAKYKEGLSQITILRKSINILRRPNWSAILPIKALPASPIKLPAPIRPTQKSVILI